VRFAPRLGWDFEVALQPEIEVQFNNLIDTGLVTDAATLNALVILTRMDTDETMNVVYVSWDPVTRVLKLQPEEFLAAGALYQITVRKDLRTAEGRGMLRDKTWSFTTGLNGVGTVTLREPGDATAWPAPPTLRWDGVAFASGSATYEVQVHSIWQFPATPLWATTITVSGSGGIHQADIGTSLTENSPYYWRVRAFTTAATGDWSETWSFYVGSPVRSSPDTTLLYNPAVDFLLAELEPEAGSSHLAVFPSIRATFTRPLSGASITTGTVVVSTMPADGRGGGIQTPNTSGVTLSVLDGTIVDVAIAGDIAKNTRYTITFKKAIRSASGDLLGSDVATFFSGPYMPLYGGLEQVRTSLGVLLDGVTDDEINYNLWRASIGVNELVATLNHTIRTRISIEDLINYVPSYLGFGHHRYAELTAAIGLLEEYYATLLKEAGRRGELATFVFEVDVHLLEELRARIKELQDERDQVAATYLYGAVIPMVTIKSSRWNPANPYQNRDDSYCPRRQFGHKRTRWDHWNSRSRRDREREGDN
jgi:hypothetical protein